MATYELGPVEEFPTGSRKLVSIGRLEVGVFNVDGRLYAVPNRCPHQQGPLCEGPVVGEWSCSAETGWRFAYDRDAGIVICPWHGIEFDLASGRCLSSERLAVRSFPVTVADGKVTLSTDRS